MGIKGIYEEIGSGDRISLAKLSVEKLEQTGRPLRIAIDISIWQFQIQSGRGGSNPALRTLYYRLLRLLSLCIQPLFVFDGPHKPPFKRNKRTGPTTSSVPNLLTKQMLKYFGFPFHIAPGEAEAECALLQRHGIVDAVLSEDVDTLMFGCGLTLRNWSSESSKSNHSPTHVSVYDAKATKDGKSGLDRQGMVLVALMSGGDYIPEGIPGCGIKVACQAARAGYGRSLCQLSQSDAAGLNAWREDLAYQLQTNELKHFRFRHKALKIPETFPNKEVLKYYTHPVVSNDSKIAALRDEINWNEELDISGLRAWVAEAFDWTGKSGANKFIRNLAPALLVSKLRARADRPASGHDDVVFTAMNEMELVRAICGKRNHTSVDGLPELRLIYLPADIVGLNMDAELDDSHEYGRDGLAPRDEDDNFEPYRSDDDASLKSGSVSPTKRGAPVYDPTRPEKLWVLETVVKIGVPLKAEDYDESLRNPLKGYKNKAGAKKAMKGGMPKGALDRYFSVIKPQLHEGTTFREPRKLSIPEFNVLPVFTASPLEPMAPTETNYGIGYVRPRREHFKILEAAKGKASSSNPTQESLKYKNGSTPVSKRATTNTINNPWVLSSSPRISPGFNVSKSVPQENYITTLASPPTKHNLQVVIPVPLPASHPGVQNQILCGLSDRSNSPFEVKKSSPKPSDTFLDVPLIEDVLESSTKRRINIFANSKAHIQHPLEDLMSKENLVSQSELFHGISTNNKEDGQKAMREVFCVSSSPTEPRKLTGMAGQKQLEPGKAKAKRFFMLRESLEGSWKEITEQQNIAFEEQGKDRAIARGTGGRRMWRESQVEELDMTAGE